MFATEIGTAINPRTDWDAWKSLLRRAGVRDSRLHDARHTAATCLLLLGVSPRATMALMGWTDPAMMQRYQHMVAPLRADVAQRLGGLLWDEGASERGPTETETETRTRNVGEPQKG